MNAIHLFKTKMVKKMENKGNEIIEADNSTLLDKKMKAIVCTIYLLLPFIFYIKNIFLEIYHEEKGSYCAGRQCAD